MMYFSNCQPQ
ncbi:unnamed protein product [Lasius platythorax]|uniref:Uncharacterized protein n=1 Tax=Lasius platythorax TaxID=488582 RepID=A0AAV2NE77_9HYME